MLILNSNLSLSPPLFHFGKFPFEILLSYKKEWNNAICSNMYRPRDDHTKRSKSEKDNSIWHHLQGYLKYDTDELIYKTETDL